MAALTAKQRKKIPKDKFAGPDGSYPVEDKTHAANAKARASQAVNAGRMTASEESSIDAKANAVLHKGAAAASTAHTAKFHGSKGKR